MNNITINKGNIEKHGLSLNYKSAIVLSTINHVFQNNFKSPFDKIVDENGIIWYACSNSSIIKLVPILKLQKSACRIIVNDLISLGFIERHVDSIILSKTFLRPFENFRLYFETDKIEVNLNQKLCYEFDKQLNPLHWFLLEKLENNSKNRNLDFEDINDDLILKSLSVIIKNKTIYKTLLAQLVSFNYLEKSKVQGVNKHYYKGGAKLLEYKELKNRERTF